MQMTRGNQGHLLIMFGSDGAERYLVKRFQVIVRPVVVCPLQKAEQSEAVRMARSTMMALWKTQRKCSRAVRSHAYKGLLSRGATS